MELADLPGHPARRIASRHKKLLRYLIDIDTGIAALPEEDVGSIHDARDKSYCTAAEEAALTLISIQNDAMPPRCASAPGSMGKNRP
jgi:hypothetical protein